MSVSLPVNASVFRNAVVRRFSDTRQAFFAWSQKYSQVNQQPDDLTEVSASETTENRVGVSNGCTEGSSSEEFDEFDEIEEHETVFIFGSQEDIEDEEERRNDREEIRRKLAMDPESDDYYCGERVTRKPSLTKRLQSGMNLQICFMNETASDQEGQGSDQDADNSLSGRKSLLLPSSHLLDASSVSQLSPAQGDKVPPHTQGIANNTITNGSSISNRNPNGNNNKGQTNNKRQRPSFFFNRQRSWRLGQLRQSSKEKDERKEEETEEDFLTRHARLQAEARLALAQAKEMARMQMEVERQRKKKSPIAEIVGIPFPDGRHQLSRQSMLEMNVAQLQVIVNDLHTQIESLNEDLVRLLLERDDLHMEQDSMLVDIEDLTRYLGAKDAAQRSQQSPPTTRMKAVK